MGKIFVRASKDLKHDDGTLSFIKGREYETVHDWYYSTSQLQGETPVRNEQGRTHILGVWLRYFKAVHLTK